MRFLNSEKGPKCTKFDTIAGGTEFTFLSPRTLHPLLALWASHLAYPHISPWRRLCSLWLRLCTEKVCLGILQRAGAGGDEKQVPGVLYTDRTDSSNHQQQRARHWVQHRFRYGAQWNHERTYYASRVSPSFSTSTRGYVFLVFVCCLIGLSVSSIARSKCCGRILVTSLERTGVWNRWLDFTGNLDWEADPGITCWFVRATRVGTTHL